MPTLAQKLATFHREEYSCASAWRDANARSI